MKQYDANTLFVSINNANVLINDNVCNLPIPL